MTSDHIAPGEDVDAPVNNGPTVTPHLKRVLTLPSLVLFGIVYMVPLTVFSTYGIVTEETGGRLPLAYLVTLIVMSFTAWSYGAMSREYPVAGSAYAYATNTFGGNVGFASGWSLLMDYMFLPMINYLIIGIYLHAEFESIPAWVFVAVSILLVTVLNVIGITSVDRVSKVIVLVQSIFIVVFVVMSIKTIAGGPAPDVMAPFTGDHGGVAPILAGAAVLCLSFLGFDAVSTLSEEAKHPKRDVPRAIVLTTLAAGVIFIGLSYLAHLDFPSHEFADPDAGALDVMTAAGGDFLANFFTAAAIAGALGSALTSQASVSRILYSMGRDNVLPRKVFGMLSPRFLTPVNAVLIVSVVSLLAVVLDLTTLASMISFGALVAFSVVNLAVIKHYIFDSGRRDPMSLVLYGLVPLIGFGLTLWLWTSLSSTALIVGLGWLAVGITYLAVLTRGFRRPPPSMDVEH